MTVYYESADKQSAQVAPRELKEPPRDGTGKPMKLVKKVPKCVLTMDAELLPPGGGMKAAPV